MPTANISPFEKAVDRLLGKNVVASTMNTQDWQTTVPLSIRDRAFFSSTIDSERVLSAMKDKLNEALTLGRERPERALMSKDKFVAEMRQTLGAPEGDTGKLTDITSQRRLELVYDFQQEDAYEFGRFQMGSDPDVLDAFPAQELIRIEDRKVPRDWIARWQEAGGELVDGRMIAPKGDPIWAKISAFDKPWPPFDFGSGMGVEDIDREEAEALGVIEPGQQIEGSPAENFNATLEADAANLDSESLDYIQTRFGDQVDVSSGKVKWKN